MKGQKLIGTVGLVVLAIALASCGYVANRSTIERHTPIPELGDNAKSNKKKKWVKGDAVAIHLDAQQRLVLATAKGYCAEPSPDALSAYVATLGVGATTPSKTQAAVSLARVLQGSTASIGLRTQSITLMRDALYRMCEAANNGHLDKIHVTRFLRRSQDLTAVILAVEQLTGATAANQVILTPESSADASANLTANQQLLDQQRKRVDTFEKAVQEIQSKLEDAKATHERRKEDFNAEQRAYAEARDKPAALEPPPEGSPQEGSSRGAAVTGKPTIEADQLAHLEAELKKAKTALEKAEEGVESAEAELKLAKQRWEDAKEVLEVVQKSRDAALTNVTTETRSSGRFSSVEQRNKLDDKSTKAVSKAVKEMVNTVVLKDYTKELCLSYLISDQNRREKRIQLLLTLQGLDKDIDALGAPPFNQNSEQKNKLQTLQTRKRELRKQVDKSFTMDQPLADNNALALSICKVLLNAEVAPDATTGGTSLNPRKP